MKNTNTIFTLFLLIAGFTKQAQVFVNLPLHNQVDHVQPMTGIVFWADNTNDLNNLGDKTQLEFAYLVYSDVIEQEGVYDWSSVDDLLADAESHSRQVVLRFRYTYPGETQRSVPSYIASANGYTQQIVSVEGSNTYIPDWSNEPLEDFTLEFYTEFAARYDNDSRLAFVQVGFGSYSEYHLYDGPFTLGVTFPTKAFQTTFLNHVNSEFVNTQWSVSIDAAEGNYTPISSSASLKNLNYGLFDDSFLHEEHSENNNEYNRAAWLLFGEDRADTRAAGGELNYYSDYDQQHVLDKVGGPWGTTYEELSAMYDITYMIGNDQYNYQTATRIEEAGMSNGYRYEVTVFSTDGNNTEVTIKNNGIAPIYYDAFPTVNGVRSTETLKGLITGESRTFIIATEAIGEDLTITSDRLVTGQEIQFDANLEGTTTGLYEKTKLLGNVFPNPFKDQLIIKNTEIIEVTITNISGEVVYEITTNQDLNVNTSEFSSGVYLLTVSSAQHNKVSRIVKQ